MTNSDWPISLPDPPASCTANAPNIDTNWISGSLKGSPRGASKSGTIVTLTLQTGSFTDWAVGDPITVAGVGVAGYNGSFTVASVISNTQITYIAADSTPLAASGGGTVTHTPGTYCYTGKITVKSSFTGYTLVSTAPTGGAINCSVNGVSMTAPSTPDPAPKNNLLLYAVEGSVVFSGAVTTTGMIFAPGSIAAAPAISYTTALNTETGFLMATRSRSTTVRQRSSAQARGTRRPDDDLHDHDDDLHDHEHPGHDEHDHDGDAGRAARVAPRPRTATSSRPSPSADRPSAGEYGRLLELAVPDDNRSIMRTTLTLDDDVAALIESERARTGESFRAAVNRLLRRGTRAGAARPAPPLPELPGRLEIAALAVEHGLVPATPDQGFRRFARLRLFDPLA